MSEGATSGGKPPKKSDGNRIFVTFYRHWRSGKIMKASDYGYKAWSFLAKKK